MATGNLKSIKEISLALDCSKVTVWRRVKSEDIRVTPINGPNGVQDMVDLADMPAKWQLALYNTSNNDAEKLALIPALKPSVAVPLVRELSAEADLPFNRTFTETALARQAESPAEKTARLEQAGRDFAALMKPRVQRIAMICEEVEQCPPDWGRDAWIKMLADKHGVCRQTIYKYLDRRKKKGLVGLDHTKKTKGGATAWTPEARDHWFGLCFKQEHRHIKKKNLYDILFIEANRRGWRIGGLESAQWQYRHHPQRRLLEAYQKGGTRGLDNALAPILRDYSDMAPMQCLVGDQHRKNRWVVDDFTGDVVRIEAYMWQDLRTRIIYGGACAKHYDSYLMGLALRMGMRIYGAFSSVYNDNGKPETSLYFKGIMKLMKSYGLQVRQTIALPADLLDVDPEEVYPACEEPGMQRLAIVENAKAKMIEGTWRVLDDIMTSVFLLPGNSKRLTDDIHTQDIDQKELKKLAAAGQLPLLSQYLITFYKALDYYNRVKPHRGVAKEWRWANRPKTVTPYDCLMKCYADGWRPRFLSDEAVNLLFMMEENRTINRGHITAFNDTYVHDDLLTLHGERVQIRYDLVDQGSLMVFHEGQFICMATPIEYSSMIDADLTRKKIHEKRRKAKEITELYQSLSRPIADVRTFASAEQAEQVAALMTAAKEQKMIEYRESSRELTQEELDAAVAKLEQGLPLPAKAKKTAPERPGYFLDEINRFEWCIKYEAAGGTLTETDQAFVAAYESQQTPDQREYWQTVREFGG